MDNKKKYNAKEQKKRFDESIANRFLSVLTLKGAEWVKEWEGPSMRPFNGATRYRYKGVNLFNLALAAIAYRYNDPRWFTFNQIADFKGYYHKGSKWHLKEGSQGIPVEYYFPYDTVERKNLTWEEHRKLIKEEGRDPAEFYLKARYSVVFNGAQIEGIEPYNPEDIPTYDSAPNETIMELARKMEVDVEFDGKDSAYYSLKSDTIHLPKAEHFFTSVAWAGTALHELVHASGAEKRLNRPSLPLFGKEDYAYEELVAEIGSCLMCYNLGIEESEENIKNHEAYVATWIKSIREKPESLTKAIKEAQKATDYMIGLLDDADSSPGDDAEEVTLDVA